MKSRVLEIELDDELYIESEDVGLLSSQKWTPKSNNNNRSVLKRRPWLVGLTVALCFFTLIYLSSHSTTNEQSTTKEPKKEHDSTDVSKMENEGKATQVLEETPVEETNDGALDDIDDEIEEENNREEPEEPKNDVVEAEPESGSLGTFDWQEPENLSVPFECPKEQAEALNVQNARTEHEEWYEKVSDRMASDFNATNFMENFRNVAEYDNWGHSYEEVKKGMYQWKSTKFLDLKDGDAIYESACGIGLNLYMTLEILNEINGLKNVEVYGNEYVKTSVDIANTIIGNGYLPGNGQLGRICAADSAELDFVPRRKFDLVFSGYISPLFNPLGLTGASTDENFEVYNAYCEQNDPKAAEAQRQQERWYGKWVTQMVRLAKPGAPIIIEQVSYP